MEEDVRVDYSSIFADFYRLKIKIWCVKLRVPFQQMSFYINCISRVHANILTKLTLFHATACQFY